MASNCFFLLLFWPNIFSHLAAFNYNRHWSTDLRVDDVLILVKLGPAHTRSDETTTRILYRFRLFCEYIHLDYVRIHVVYRVTQAEYAICIAVAAPLE